MRLFFAIDIPQEIKLGFFEKAKGWDLYRRVRPENFHITLVFLGEKDPSDVERLILSGRKIADQHRSFEVGFSLLTTKRDMLWAVPGGIYLPLESLQKDLQNSLLENDLLTPSELPFRPHIKLGWTDQVGKTQMPELKISVREFALYETEFLPNRGGVRHHAVEKFTLKD